MGTLVEEAQRQGLEMTKQVPAQVLDHALGHPGHQVGLQPGPGCRDDVGQDHQADQVGQAGQVAFIDVLVDRQSHQERTHQVHCGGDDHQEGRTDQNPALAP